MPCTALDQPSLPFWKIHPCAACLLHSRDPAFRHVDRIQADDTGRLRSHPLWTVWQDRLGSRTGARQSSHLASSSLPSLPESDRRCSPSSRPVLAPTSPQLETQWRLSLAPLPSWALAFFGSGVANGIVSGGPQLGAGSALGRGIAAGAGLAAGTAGLAGGAIAGSLRGASSVACGAAAASRSGTSSGAETTASGAASPLRSLQAGLGGGSSNAGGEGNSPDASGSPPPGSAE